MHDAANPFQLSRFVGLYRVLVIVVFLAVVHQNARLDIQFRNEGLHPHVAGSYDRCPTLVVATAHLDTMRAVGLVRADARNGEVFVEHLGDDAIEHCFVVGGHDESISRLRWAGYVQHRLDAHCRGDYGLDLWNCAVKGSSNASEKTNGLSCIQGLSGEEKDAGAMRATVHQLFAARPLPQLPIRHTRRHGAQ